jgi:hypothetical protein
MLSTVRFVLKDIAGFHRNGFKKFKVIHMVFIMLVIVSIITF